MNPEVPSPDIPETLDALRVPVESLNPYSDNPRRGDLERIVESLERNGQYRPIVVNKRDRSILAGNHTFHAAKSLGWNEIAATFVDASDEEARRIVLVDNRTNDLAAYDDEALIGMLDAIREAEGPDGLLGTGFLESELDQLLADFDGGSREDDERYSEPDDLPEQPEPTTKVGDLWHLGDHRLLCGDSTDPEAVARLCGDESAALLFTSPPYGDAREYRGGKDLGVDNLASVLERFADRAKLLAVNLGILRKDGAIVPYWQAYIDAAERGGLKLVSWNVWDRATAFSIAQQTAMFPIEHEWIFCFAREPFDLNRTVENKGGGKIMTGVSNRQKDGTVSRKKRVRVHSHRPIGTIIRESPALGENSEHPAIFPVRLPAHYIEAASDPGDLILDPFLGSGTTLIAAHDLGRRCSGLELDPAYCDLILRRFQEYTGKQPTRDGDAHDFGS